MKRLFSDLLVSKPIKQLENDKEEEMKDEENWAQKFLTNKSPYELNPIDQETIQNMSDDEFDQIELNKKE